VEGTSEGARNANRGLPIGIHREALPVDRIEDMRGGLAAGIAALPARSVVPVARDRRARLPQDAVAVGQGLHGLAHRLGRVRCVLHDLGAPAELALLERDGTEVDLHVAELVLDFDHVPLRFSNVVFADARCVARCLASLRDDRLVSMTNRCDHRWRWRSVRGERVGRAAQGGNRHRARR